MLLMHLMMRAFIISAVLGAAVMTLSADPKVKTGKTVTANSTNRFEITGMTCDGCAKGVASELKRVPGVASATVTFSNKLAVVAIDTNKVTSRKLINTIEEAGYKAKAKE